MSLPYKAQQLLDELMAKRKEQVQHPAPLPKPSHALPKNVMPFEAGQKLSSKSQPEENQKKAEESDVPYRFIKSDGELAEYIPAFHESTVMGIDTETTGLDPYLNKIRTIQIAAKGLYTLVIDLWCLGEAGRSLLNDLLSSPITKTIHNAVFDLKFLKREGFTVAGLIIDTMLAAQLLKAGIRSTGNKLSDLSRTFLRKELPKTEQLSDWGKDLTEEQISYAARDASTVLELSVILRTELKKHGLEKVAFLEFKCIPAVVEMELNGMLVDKALLNNLSQQLVNEQALTDARLREIIGNSLGAEKAKLNLNSTKQLRSALNEMRIPVDSTAKAALIPLESQYPILSVILGYRKVSKRLQAFSEKLPAHIHPMTGRVHSHYRQMGADTGRFSCNNFNIQQIPRGKAYRECFVAPPGCKWVIADYSMIELRVVAELSGDTVMIEAFKKGVDLHKLTASLMANKPIDQITKEERQAAKALNFGLIYAMGVDGLKSYAKSIYNVDMSIKEAQAFHKRFFTSYIGIANWHKQIKANRPTEIRTLTGRRRMWDEWPRITELFNTPVQGTAADIVKVALVFLVQELEGTEAKILATCHDEIIVECPESQAEQIAAVLKETMERAGGMLLKSVPVIAEVSIGDNWAEK